MIQEIKRIVFEQDPSAKIYPVAFVPKIQSQIIIKMRKIHTGLLSWLLIVLLILLPRVAATQETGGSPW